VSHRLRLADSPSVLAATWQTDGHSECEWENNSRPVTRLEDIRLGRASNRAGFQRSRAQPFTTRLAAFSHSRGAEGANAMLFIVFVCLLLWFLGFMTTTTLGGALHVLLIIAVVFLLLHVIQGRPIGD
jgi:uncharacterized protein DUF5670